MPLLTNSCGEPVFESRDGSVFPSTEALTDDWVTEREILHIGNLRTGIGSAQFLLGAKGKATCREKTTKLWPKMKKARFWVERSDRGACRRPRCDYHRFGKTFLTYRYSDLRCASAVFLLTLVYLGTSKHVVTQKNSILTGSP
jgi:hypothetical protein